MAAAKRRPLRVAIVGAGPAGLYAAGHLLEHPSGTYLDGRMLRLTGAQIEVDVIDRLPTPWGLVRGGVAPDHPEKKLVSRVFEAIAERPGFRFFANVEVGRDLRHDELAEWYDAVVYAVGAAGDPRMGIPGEELAGCWAAREFVAWYNGHPDFSALEFDLSCERAVVVGNGNVALDVARILLLGADELERTDIAVHALDALRASAIREVVVLGRRGHLQSAFSNPEVEELGELAHIDVVVDRQDLPDQDEVVLGYADWTILRKARTLRSYAERPPSGNSKRVVLRFLTSPIELLGSQRVDSVRVVRNRLERDSDGRLRARATAEESVIEAGLVLRSVGYFGTPIAGLPFDEIRGVIPNQDGRVVGPGGTEAGVFVTGWIKRGPQGIIGTNKKCARDTVRALLADAAADRLPTGGTLDAESVARALRARRPNLVNYAGWRLIDRRERRIGRLTGRPRVKVTTIDDALEIAGGALQH
jgi:ferredoxin--NADP+ reductase